MTDLSSFQSQVTIPADYFYRMSMMDYNTPHEALIREFFQNSIDAGCKTFIVFFDDEQQEITFVDDGCGMDEDVLRNRLLVMGGSFKPNAGAIGDFGHAKILIYFSWESYEIRTNNLQVLGRSNLYTIASAGETEAIHGTSSRIRIQDETDYMKVKASVERYFSYCDTSARVIYVDLDQEGEFHTKEIQQSLNPITLINLENSGFDALIGSGLDDDYDHRYVYVRSRGVYMFRRYSSVLKKPIILETKLRASTVFVQNRDSFKREYQDQFSSFLARLNNDNLSMASTNYQQFISKTRTPASDGRKRERGEIELCLDFFTMGATRKEAERYFTKKRAARLKLFVENLTDLLRSRAGLAERIACGFVFDDSVEGLASKADGNRFVLYVNPLQIEERIRDRRWVAYKAWDVVIHEFAHIWSIIDDGNTSHNEGFTEKAHRARDLIWDQREIQAIFNECWNSVK